MVDRLLKLFLTVCCIVLIVGFGMLYKNVFDLQTRLEKIPAKTESKVNIITDPQATPTNDNCGPSCQAAIKAQVSQAVATLSSSRSTITPVTTKKSVQTTYIPLAGSATTTNTDWTDASGTDVNIDVANDYGANTYITWDATLKTNGSGTAFARLFDVTHGIAVPGSEIGVSSGSYTQATSSQLQLWQGKNIYRVQVKSLDSNEITFGSGRIKVVY
jgi:hypothetical protein